MSIKIDLVNQVRQTSLPAWKPLLPLFEAVMNSIQAIQQAELPASVEGRIVIEVLRDQSLFKDELPPVVGFTIKDNGIGLDDNNFDSFNTAFSPHKLRLGGKGLGRFTWLKAFDLAQIESTFRDDAAFRTRRFIFDQNYDLDERGLPVPGTGPSGTAINLVGLRREYRSQCPKTADALIEKIIDHFILVFLEPQCPKIILQDQGMSYDLNTIFAKDYKSSASEHKFKINDHTFVLHGFRLPTSRTTKHKLVYAADQRAVVSDTLEEHVPNLAGRLEDEQGHAFFYLAVIQSPYLSEHVNTNRTDFDFSSTGDADMEFNFTGERLIPRAEIRDKALPFIEQDLEAIIQTINAAKLERVREYIANHAPQYRILLRYASEFINKLPPRPNRNQIEGALHQELHEREVALRRKSTQIIKEAAKIENYEEYRQRLSDFLDQYNEIGSSALVQYVAHRKIILEFLERAMQRQDDEQRYPLEEVVHKLVFPMHGTSNDIPYPEQNLWMIDERLTYHSLIASDKQLRSIELLKTNSAKRGDIVIFDEKIIFADVDPVEHPINSITTIEFKRPGRDDYTMGDNPLEQALDLIEDIRNAKFQVKGRPVSAANSLIPASAYIVCDVTPSMQKVLRRYDAFATPDKQGYYGFHRDYNVYYEVIGYNKMLRDAKKRNRIFFERLNLPST